MSTISNNERNERSKNILANKSVSPSGSILETAPNPFIEGFQYSPGSTAAKVLEPVYPNPDSGFEILSEFQKVQITRHTPKNTRRLCADRGIKLDFEFWEKHTRRILGLPTPEDAIVVPAPTGAGKSTWIEAFHLALKDLFKKNPALDKAIVGTVIVLQKVDSLNSLAAELNEGCPADRPFMVALQGWSQSGKQLGTALTPM